LSDTHSEAAGRTADAAAHGERLLTRLCQVIDEAGGAVDFSEFMHRVLYEPGLGYYVTGHRKFGAQGDFVTAPEMGALFGRCLASQCAEVLEKLEGGSVLEFGAGTGRLCTRLLESLREAGRLPEAYYILELSPELRERQQRAVAERCPELLGRCRWLEHLPDGFNGVVIANEVLDAMPVERFRVTEQGVEIIQVARSGNSLRETARPAGPGELADIDTTGLPLGYESELGVLARQWVASIPDWLRRGVVLIIDYGFPAHEYYHPERNQGTLMCHYRHKAHTDPYRHIGMQDITAHLNFTALAQAACDAGLEVLGFTHQAAFLLSLGLLDWAGDDSQVPDAGQWRLSQEVQRLAQPHEMGELFKVLAVGRDYDAALGGFEFLDHRGRL